jgi:hypothetical protein
MKTVALLLAGYVLAATPVSLPAQDFATKKDDTPTLASEAPEVPQGERLTPRPSGIVYEMSEKGLIVIYPLAGPEYGYGEKFLASNPLPQMLPKAPPDHEDRRRAFGGFQLIGLEF